ncbi:hypothetical protein PanWU01x14_227880 [Parasponia andersonii]|uniref:Uncharacterized protein n=1 Tax=Parasponia andersonii TaxID=3476 RepID=A0A2P5BLS6_PARAD|nr:hypothetical protein PanWU01x14_227880 [Parasponia andersonii]
MEGVTAADGPDVGGAGGELAGEAVGGVKTDGAEAGALAGVAAGVGALEGGAEVGVGAGAEALGGGVAAGGGDEAGGDLVGAPAGAGDGAWARTEADTNARVIKKTNVELERAILVVVMKSVLERDTREREIGCMRNRVLMNRDLLEKDRHDMYIHAEVYKVG